jgi:hypothetical protein
LASHFAGRSGELVDVRRDQLGFSSDALQARLRFANVIESDDGTISIVILVDDEKGSPENKVSLRNFSNSDL